MRVRKTDKGRVLRLNRREAATIERASRILRQMQARLEARFVELGVPESDAFEEMTAFDEEFEMTVFYMNSMADEIRWPEPEDIEE